MTNASESTPDQIQALAAAANGAAPAFAATSGPTRAAFLDRIAARLEENAEALIEAAHRETALPLPRLKGELGRTTGQLRMFARLIEGDDWRDVRREAADPERSPAPKPDLRRTQVPLGPVAVFGASNFPFAFSVAGGDTASALAAGCPVVAKGHPGHPETSRLAADAILGAVADTGMPDGTFAIVWGGPEAGRALVLAPEIAAVGFTGSQRAGRALFDLGAGRPRPIPVYAEMGSVNPVFVMPGALAARGEALAGGYADSLTLGVGQFCTNPGVVVGIDGPEFEVFVARVAERLQSGTAGKMLTEGIATTYAEGVATRRAHPELTAVHAGEGTSSALFTVGAEAFLAHPELQEELFGPAAIAVTCRDAEEMRRVAEGLEGQLTATIQFEDADRPAVRRLLPLLVRLAGRIVANGFPTGVEVNSAMHHGGPYPATTDARATSVGTAAILRFVRPVAFQDVPEDLLPPELR